MPEVILQHTGETDALFLVPVPKAPGRLQTSFDLVSLGWGTLSHPGSILHVHSERLKRRKRDYLWTILAAATKDIYIEYV